MAGSSLHVHTFLACQNISWDGPAGPRTTRTLEGVGFVYHTDMPDGFPYESTFWFFVRVGHDRRRTVSKNLYLTMVWIDDPQLRPEVWSRPFHSTTLTPGTGIRDIATRSTGVFEGRGTYEFQLWYKVKRKWDQRVRRRVIARTSIQVES